MKKLTKYIYYLVFLLILFIFKTPINYVFKNVNTLFSKNDHSEIKILEKENKILRNELKELDVSDYDRFIYTKSKVIERNIYYFYDYIIVDKGKKDDIKINMAVVYNNNLIGIVKKVSKLNSKVRLITSSDLKISIKINDVYGVVEKYDKLKNLYQATVTKNSNLKLNDKIYTSGLGVIPSDIYIGKVVKIKNENLNTKVYFKTDFNINNIQNVLILKGE